MKIITQAEVERHLSMPECIGAMRKAMTDVSNGAAHLPIRQFMPIDGAPGKLALMPGAIKDPWCFGIKLVCKYERAPDSPYGTHVGMVMLFDAAEGVPLAMIEGSALTGVRTAAASALATDLLARPEASRLFVMGCGEQARRHVAAMRAVREIDAIEVWGRNPARAQAFCDKIEADLGARAEPVTDAASAAGRADIICTTTASKEPILMGAWPSPGVHVNLVGSAIPSTAEADVECVARSIYVVDYRAAALAAAGELLRAFEAGRVSETHIAAEIGEVCAGRHPGRTDAEDITVYKSLGVSAQDLAAAHILYEKACAEGFGLSVEMMDLP